MFIYSLNEDPKLFPGWNKWKETGNQVLPRHLWSGGKDQRGGVAHEWEKGRVRKSAKLYGKLLLCVPSIFVHTSSLIELKRKKKKSMPSGCYWSKRIYFNLITEVIANFLFFKKKKISTLEDLTHWFLFDINIFEISLYISW